METNHATTIATLAIDTTHGCHLQATRDAGEFGTALTFLYDAADAMNSDADVRAEYGTMPLPTSCIYREDETIVVYADGSAIRFEWDADGLADAMEILPSVGAKATHRFV